jgi:hypothetical protein
MEINNLSAAQAHLLAAKAHLTEVIDQKLPVTRKTVEAAEIVFKAIAFKKESGERDTSLIELGNKVEAFIKPGTGLSGLSAKINSFFSSVRHMFSGGSSYTLVREAASKELNDHKVDRVLAKVPALKAYLKEIKKDIDEFKSGMKENHVQYGEIQRKVILGKNELYTLNQQKQGLTSEKLDNRIDSLENQLKDHKTFLKETTCPEGIGDGYDIG